MPTGMICLASEQLWPTIQAIWHWLTYERLDAVAILHTADEQRSARPAQRLKKLLGTAIPRRISTELLLLPDMLPQTVSAAIATVVNAMPDMQWIINITGGTKLMTAGALSLIRLPHTRFLYCELPNNWYELTADHSTGSLAATPLTINCTVTNHIQVSDIIKTQFESIAGEHWRWDPAPDLPLLEITRHAIACNWHWETAFRQAGLKTNEQGGFLFEKYIAALIKQLGIGSVAINGTETSPSGKALQELDIVANHNACLHLFDCKLTLPSDEGGLASPLVNQIKHAAQTRRSLGGLAARCFLIRPAIRFTEEQCAFAQASQVHLLGKQEMCTLPSRLADAFRVPLPSQLSKLECLLHTAYDELGNVFAAAKPIHRAARQAGINDNVVNLDLFLRSWLDESARSWVAIYWRSSYHVFVRFPIKQHESARQIFDEQLARIFTIKNLHITWGESRAYAWIVIDCKNENDAKHVKAKLTCLDKIMPPASPSPSAS